jgi:hypothetical protein
VLAVTILMRTLLFYAPKLAANSHDPVPWTSGLELLAMCGAALVLARTNTTVTLGRFLFAVPLVVFGVQHFLSAHFKVPSWIPGHLFWAYFVGVAFVAAALSIAAQIKPGLAATWLGIMFQLWVLVLIGPE